MIEKVTGIILTEVHYGETSKIINVLTKEHGMVGIMAKGAYSLKSKLRVGTLKYTYGYFHIYYKPNKLSDLIAVDIIDTLEYIKSDIIKISFLAYLCDLTYQVFKQNNSEDIYNILISSIIKINQGLEPKIITNIVELKYLDFLGVSLSLDSCVKCGNTNSIITIDGDAGGYLCSNCHTNELIVNPKTIKMLRMYYLVDINSISNLSISNEVVSDIDRFLNRYYERYTGLYLKSKDFLKSLQ